ncbi:catabolite control protein A [Spirochaetia bacterium]|nr:catabolite control protein A [Spirochaetia bacterium]
MQIATIADVARIAGVSIATVSRVKNKSNLVSVEKRNRVYSAMQELGYKPDAPENIFRGKGKIVLVVCHGFYLFEDILNGIVDAAKGLDADYNVVVCQTGQAEDGYRKALSTIRLIPQELLSGIIFYNNMCDDSDVWSEVQRYPLVQIGEYNKSDPCFAVMTNDEEAENDITSLLISKGRKRFAFLANQNLDGRKRNQFCIKREEGFRSALLAGGIPIDEKMFFAVDYTPEGGVEAAKRIMEMDVRPDAIVCASDMIAMGVLRELNRQGVSVPGEIAITGFDDSDFSEFLSPGLTTVRQSYWELGVEAIRMLDSLINGSLQSGRITYIKHTLIEREST